MSDDQDRIVSGISQKAADSQDASAEKARGERSGTLDRAFAMVAILVLFPALRLLFPFANALRLEQMQRQGKPNMKSLAAEPAANRELEQSKTGNIG